MLPMNISNMADEDGKGFMLAFDGTDVEGVDPLEFYREQKIRINMVLYREILRRRNPIRTAFLSDSFFRERAHASWSKLYDKIQRAELHDNFLQLLESGRKAEQITLLRGQRITTLGLASLLFRAGTEYGYLLSKYRSEFLPKGTVVEHLPQMFRLAASGVKRIGYSPLTDGQLKNVILQRKVLVAHFLDREDAWHCFFQTEKSMRGGESWEGGQPHIHYISNKWGIGREEILKQIKGGWHPSTPVHIALTDYSPPPGRNDCYAE